MGPYGAPFLGTKRPREEHETADDKSEPPAVGYPSSMVAEVGNTVAEQCNEEEHNSPPRHTPGVTPGGFNIHRTVSFDDIEEMERDRVTREESLAATLRASSPGSGEGELDQQLGAAGQGASHDQAPQAAEATPRHRRVDSLGGDADITLSPGELGGSQYIMSPGDLLATSLQRTQSVVSDGQSAPPSSVEEVAAEQLRSSQRLFPIFVKGRKVVHLVRHGQSTYNEAINGPGSWDEPNIFDAPLTKLGVSQAKSLGVFLSKLPKETVWVTSALTRAMETCVYGYKSSLEVKQMRERKGAAVREAAAGGANARGKSRLSQGGAGGSLGGNGNGEGPRASDENGYVDGTPMVDADAGAAAADVREGAGGSGAGVGSSGQQPHCDQRTPAPAADGCRARRLCSEVGGELAPDAVGASPSEVMELDGADMTAWGDKVIVHQHLSEKLSTSGDIGRCKGVLMNEFPLLALGLSRLPGDVWWYSQANRSNDAEREQFGSHEPAAKFKERVDKFRHWLMSREDKVFVVFGHSTFFKELTGGHRSLKNCEVHTYHL